MMLSSNISRILLFFCMLSLFSHSKGASLIYHFCVNATFYTPNSTYQANLDTLLSSLSSNATRESGFYNTTAGSNAQNAAYGIFLCRGDVAPISCLECVTAASKDIVELCPRDKRAYIWYDFCLLRYADEPIFSMVEEFPIVTKVNPSNVTERFMQLLAGTMSELATRAAITDRSGKKFATREANFTSNQTLYSLAQCTPDLSQADCGRCLQDAIAQLHICCDGKEGGRGMFPSCYVWYETSPFYRIVAPFPPATPAPLSAPPSSIATLKGKRKMSTRKIIAIVATIGVSVALISIGCCFLVRKARKKDDATRKENVVNEITTIESLQFDLGTIRAATNNFSDVNRIGQGGFGTVYKGRLPNGQDIAVKRLSRSSKQGAKEFKNEVVLVAKLQHKNLVRLRGFCLEGEEKILLYEFVPNKSLDYFLSNLDKQGQLDWSTRYNIIVGIARGILYLHEDSRLKIIHRDLKASNILLDEDMKPKISDFGLAKVFGVDQTKESTNTIAGTFGYMSPEYAFHGQFSVKFDVYSFGVLVLEIISGKKNSRFGESQSDYGRNLMSYAWKQWRDGTPLELMDPTLANSYSRNEVVRCIHIGLLCVQEDMNARPSMASIVLMLNIHSVILPLPQRPAFFLHSRTESNMPNSDQSTSKSAPYSGNEAPSTELYPRA